MALCGHDTWMHFVVAASHTGFLDSNHTLPLCQTRLVESAVRIDHGVAVVRCKGTPLHAASVIRLCHAAARNLASQSLVIFTQI